MRWYETDGITLKANQAYTFKYFPSSSELVALYFRAKSDGTTLAQGSNSVTYTPTADTTVYLQAYRTNISTGDTRYLLIKDSTAPTSWTPYSNICPIRGHTEVETVVSPTTSADDGDTYTTALGRTVYGGTLDVVSGELTVTDANIASYNGETLPATWISDRDEYASGTTPTTGAQVVYELATPQTYQLTPQEVSLLQGTNNVWSDGGDVTLEYGTSPWYNPTPFDAKPLIKVTGTGTVQINDVTIAISESPTTIDCEAMEAYNGTESRNGDIVLTPNEFPTLHEGMNEVEAGSGITALEITPRWWRV